MKPKDAEALTEDLAKVGDTMGMLVEVLERGDREAESTRVKLAAAVGPIRAVAEVLEGFAGAVLSVQTRGGTYDGRAVVKVADGLRALAGLLDEPRWEDPAWHEQLDASIPTAIEGREVVEAMSNIDLVPVEALSPGPEDSLTPSVVEDLLANPPISKADCLRRLRDVDLEDVRKELLRRTTMTMMTEERGQAAADILHAIGPGDAVDELERIVSSTELPVPSRYWALNVLKRGWPSRGERVFGELPDGGVGLYLHGLGIAMEMVPESPRQGAILMARIAGDDRYREHLFAHVELNRVELGVPALTAYGLAVENGKRARKYKGPSSREGRLAGRRVCDPGPRRPGCPDGGTHERTVVGGACWSQGVAARFAVHVRFGACRSAEADQRSPEREARIAEGGARDDRGGSRMDRGGARMDRGGVRWDRGGVRADTGRVPRERWFGCDPPRARPDPPGEARVAPSEASARAAEACVSPGAACLTGPVASKGPPAEGAVRRP